jgi:hypothetical protein
MNTEDNKNNEGHQWTQADEETILCAKCDCWYGGKWHDLPCGSGIFLVDLVG